MSIRPRRTSAARFPALAAALACAIAASPAAAQPTAPTPRPPAAAVPEPDPAAPLINVQFDGGTVAQYVDTVKAACSQSPINVILPAEAADIPLPAIKLINVSAATALDAIVFSQPASGDYQFEVESVGSRSPRESRTFAVRFASRAKYNRTSPVAAPIAPVPPRSSRVYSLRSLIEMPEDVSAPDPALVMQIDDILPALQAAAELEQRAAGADNRDIPAPEFMLHKDSKLLIVRATESQQSLVQAIIAELRETLAPRRRRAAEAADLARAATMEKVTIQAQLEQARIQVQRCLAEVDHARARLDRTRQLHDAGHVDDMELARASRDLDTAQSNARSADVLLHSVESRLEVLNAQIAAGDTPGRRLAASFGPPVEVIYEIRDIQPFHRGLYDYLSLLLPAGWDGPEKYPPGGLAPTLNSFKGGTMQISATPDQHRLIVGYLNALRRAKSGEPDLPGLDADDLIQRARQTTP